MQGVPAIYLGRIVDKKNFRTFVYSPDGRSKLAESWQEFESDMQSGLWFATIDDAKLSTPAEKPRRVRNKTSKNDIADASNQKIKEDVQNLEEFLKEGRDSEAFEVINDDFLPE